MKRSILVLIAFFFFTSLTFSQTIQWEQLSGPHGGVIYSIVKDNAGNIYANTIGSAGPFKSTDGGETWYSIMNGLTPGDNGGFHPLNVNSTGDIFIGGAHNAGGLCRSTDEGASWTYLNNLNPGASIICISFDSNENVYVGTGTGIYKSTDNGDTWSHYGMIGSQTEAVAFNDSGHVFAGNSYAVYRSKDDGANWTQLPTGGGTRTVAVAPNGYVFAGCHENAGILRSTDNGDSWTYSYPQTVSVYFASTILFDENNYTYIPTWGNGVLFSTDFGDSWTELNNELGYKYVRTVTKTNNRYLFTGGDYGIYKMDIFNAYLNWYSVGLPICGVKEIQIDSYDNIFAGVWGVNSSYNRGLSWQTINNGLSGFDVRALTIKEDGTIFLGSGISNWAYPNPCIFRSTDNGNTWIVIENEIQRHDVEAIAVDDAGNVYAGNYYGVYKSTNNGDSWVNIGGVGGARALQFNSSGDLFLASYGQGLWQLPAGDTNWVNLTSNIGASWITCMLISANGYIYAAGKKSTDNGITWTDMGTSGSWLSCYAENSIGHLFGGDYYTGVYRSTDYGDNWQQINTGLTITDIRSLAFDSEDYLYAGTNGKSIFKTTTPTVFYYDDPSLIAHYTFDGNASDLSGYDNHGNVIGAVLTTDRFGIENSAYEFNGSSNYISIPNSLSLQSPTTELTQLAWVNIYSWTGQGFWVPVLMKSNSGDNAFQYRLSIGSNGVNTSINNWNNAVVIPDTVSFNSWFMVVSTIKNDTVKVYVNGIFKGSGSLTGPIMLDTKPLEIGRDVPGSTEYFHGKIDEIRIYNRAITEREIDSLYDGVVSIPYEDKLSIPMSFSLEQNYPNPFNPSTRISWQSPVGSHQTIKLFDVLGREIETIVDGYYEPGIHSTLYIVHSTLPSGVYFYQLRAGEYIAVKKMLYLK
jgi:photosystem II stability/assembly factor-like uncharacterized protein